MNSPRYAPAGLLIEHDHHRVMLDGGPAAEPRGRLDAWLVTDESGELMRGIRQLARAKELEPRVEAYARAGFTIVPHPVVHTSHATFGYLVAVRGLRVVWAPEFFEFPDWAAGADLMFSEAAGWNRPIRFRGGVGGHASVQDVARNAQSRGVKRLIFAHIGRPTIKAMDAGELAAFGEFGVEGKVYLPPPRE